MKIVSCWVCPLCGDISPPSVSLTLDASLGTQVMDDGDLVTYGELEPIYYRTGIIMCVKCNNIVDAPVYNPLSLKVVRSTKYYLEMVDSDRFKIMCKVYEGDELNAE
jgi:hypothetical protein